MRLSIKKISFSPSVKLFLLCFLAYMFSYFGRYDLSACQNAMINEGILTHSSASTVASAYFIFYGVGQLINGMTAVRVSPKYMLAIGLFGAGLSNILMGVFSSLTLLIIVWSLNGFFNSMLWSPIVRVFSEWLDAPSREKAGTNISLTIPLGTIGCYIIPSIVLVSYSWRWVFYICGGLVALCGVVWIFGIRSISDYTDKMSNEAYLARQASAVGKADKPRLTLAIWFGTGLMLAACVAIFNGALKEAVIQWFPSYLSDSFSFSDSRASLFATLIPLLGISGPYFAVWVNKKFTHNECLTAGVCYGISFASMGTLALVGTKSAALSIAVIALSVAAMWGVNTIILTYLSYHFGKMGISSAVSGTLNAFVYIGSVAGTKGYGKIAELFGWSTTAYVWCAVAAAAVAVSVIAGFSWKKRQPKN